MTDALAPIPVPDEETRGFWKAVAAGTLAVQRCTSCSSTYLPPRYVCERCASTAFEFVPASGRGTINSVTFVHAARHPAFDARVPYPVVLVTLDDHPQLALVANMPGTRDDEIRIGRAVRFHAHELAPGHWIPEFRLHDAAADSASAASAPPA